MDPIHVNATPADLAGNQGAGRYVLLPGSNARATQMASYLEHPDVRRHPRGHDCHLGQLYTETGEQVDVMIVATGMGCPSMEIILHELYTLGARRFLRVGTAGSMQPHYVLEGDLVNATAAVRDEGTTTDYAPIEVPALATPEMVWMVRMAAQKLGLLSHLHEGIVHCKSSFYAREFGAGPMAAENIRYMEILSRCGVLASEMETAALFVQTGIYEQECLVAGGSPALPAVMAGAILAIISISPEHFLADNRQAGVIHNSIQLALETLRVLAMHERVT